MGIDFEKNDFEKTLCEIKLFPADFSVGHSRAVLGAIRSLLELFVLTPSENLVKKAPMPRCPYR